MKGQELVTKRGARRGTVDSINGGKNEDKPEKKSEEEERIKHHLIRESS